MPITFVPPLPTNEDWIAHKEAVKRCRGMVCYGAVAAHFGTDSPKKLEWRIDRREPYGEGDSDRSSSNKFRRWRQGKALPHDDTILQVGQRSADGVRLGYWRDLPLWELLNLEPLPIQRIHRLLEGSSLAVRRILFTDDEPGKSGRFHHSMLERQEILAIRNLGSLDAFHALLCLARKGEALEDDPLHYLPSACAFDLLPRVLYSHKPLRYQWEGLFNCLERIYWKRVYITGSSYLFPIETIRASLAALDADPGTVLPRMSGNRYRVIGGDPYKRIEDDMAQAVSVT